MTPIWHSRCRSRYLYVYRELEWLKEGLGISWGDVAADVGAPLADLREFKGIANHETEVRHASSGALTNPGSSRFRAP